MFLVRIKSCLMPKVSRKRNRRLRRFGKYVADRYRDQAAQSYAATPRKRTNSPTIPRLKSKTQATNIAP